MRSCPRTRSRETGPHRSRADVGGVYGLRLPHRGACVWRRGRRRPEAAKSLWEIRFASETFVNSPVALLIWVGRNCESTIRRRTWYQWGSLVLAALFLVGGGALARNGFFAPDGGYYFILFWLLPVWAMVTAVAASPVPEQGAASARA